MFKVWYSKLATWLLSHEWLFFVEVRNQFYSETIFLHKITQYLFPFESNKGYRSLVLIIYPLTVHLLTGSVLQFLQSVFENCYNLIKSFQFSKKIMWNFRAFCHVYNNDDASKCREFKADARYFYGNRITQVFNKICVFESTALLKPLKPRSWLPAFYAKPRSWILAPSQWTLCCCSSR